MTTMISELYEALINAGATEEKAREAAVALACMDAGGRAASGTKAGTAENLNSKDTIAEVKAELAGEIAGVKKDLAELDKKMAVMQWMMGATLTGVAAIIVKLFFVA